MVGDRLEGAGVVVTSVTQSGILGVALGGVLNGGARPMVAFASRLWLPRSTTQRLPDRFLSGAHTKLGRHRNPMAVAGHRRLLRAVRRGQTLRLPAGIRECRRCVASSLPALCPRREVRDPCVELAVGVRELKRSQTRSICLESMECAQKAGSIGVPILGHAGPPWRSGPGQTSPHRSPSSAKPPSRRALRHRV